MRCRYCLPNGSPPPLPRDEILHFEEIARIVRVGARLGIARVRLTGGEPLLRRNLDQLVAMIRRVPGIGEIALTTNGLLLRPVLRDLVAAGIGHLCISVDSLEPERFRSFTGVDGLAEVRAAAEAAVAIPGLVVELNAVAIRGKSEPDLAPLVAWGRELGIPVRFIELMPFEDVNWTQDLVLGGDAILEDLAEHFGAESFEEIDRSRPAAPARRFRFRDGQGGFGLIQPVTNPFCASCDRLRLRSDGQLFNCLFARDGFDLRGPIRAGAGDERLSDILAACVRSKGQGGMLEFHEQVKNPARIMASIGG